MVYSSIKIRELIKENQSQIRKLGAKRLGLFGSYSRNEQIETSDLDFVVEFHKEQKNYKNFIHLCYFLEDLFEKKVDLLTLESLPQDRHFTKNVLMDLEFLI